MKPTVLQMTQDILSAMDSDEVNSINDTIEAQQVATIIKNCYNDIVSTIELPEQYEIFHLDASLDVAKPAVMYLPQAYENVEWVRYDKRGEAPVGTVITGLSTENGENLLVFEEGGVIVTEDVGTNPSSTNPSSPNSWTSPDGITIYFGQEEAAFGDRTGTGGTNIQYIPIKFLPRPDFLRQIYSFDSNASNVVTYSIDNTQLLCQNDKQPDYYTVFSNRTIVFDSYLSAVDTTLQSAKTFCYGKKQTGFTMTDTWVIDLDSKYLSLLFNEAKATCFFELKQSVNQRAEKMARRGWIKTQKAKAAVPYGDPAVNSLPNYGRKIR